MKINLELILHVTLILTYYLEQNVKQQRRMKCLVIK